MIDQIKAALSGFRDHVTKHATQWDDAANGSHHHHHPIWVEVAEALAALNRVEAELKGAARMEKALKKIAAYRRGGLVEQGKASGDRDDMIEIARDALPNWRKEVHTV